MKADNEAAGKFCRQRLGGGLTPSRWRQKKHLDAPEASSHDLKRS
jgi:hypothetical protein